VKVLRVGPPSGRARHQRVTLDGGTTLQVRGEDVAALGIVAGADLDDEAWDTLRRRAHSAAALESALRLLAVRFRSRREMAGRLRRKGYPADVVAAVLTRLESEGFLDDMRFSQAWVTGRLAVRPSGVARLRRELQQKGVPAQVIEQVLRMCVSESDERARALALAQARAGRYRSEPRDIAFRRLAGVLHRRGFSAGATAAALRQVLGHSVPAVE